MSLLVCALRNIRLYLRVYLLKEPLLLIDHKIVELTLPSKYLYNPVVVTVSVGSVVGMVEVSSIQITNFVSNSHRIEKRKPHIRTTLSLADDVLLQERLVKLEESDDNNTLDIPFA
jgi:hypothetical protein